MSNLHCCRFVTKTGNKVDRIATVDFVADLSPALATVDFGLCRPCVTGLYGARLFTAQTLPSISEYAKEKKTEHNFFVRSSKSEAEVTNNRRQRSTYCTIETNY